MLTIYLTGFVITTIMAATEFNKDNIDAQLSVRIVGSLMAGATWPFAIAARTYNAIRKYDRLTRRGN